MRRQNLSCDLCRRSKRRCTAVNGGPPKPPSSCGICSRYGRKCTYEFSTAQRVARTSRRRLTTQEPRLKVTKGVSAGADNEATYHDGSMCGPGSSALSMHNSTQIDELLDATPLSWRTEYWVPSGPENVDLTTSQVDRTVSPRSRRGTQSELSNGDVCRAAQDLTDECVYPNTAASSCWRTPAIHSLTQNFTRQILSEKQAIIYTVTLGWTITQYMSYSSNPFASTFKYSLVDDTGHNVHPASVEYLGTQEILENRKRSQTVNGMARFLDAFADVYGNPLGKDARKDALDALEAVTHTWSTQWLFDADCDGLSEPAGFFSRDTLLRAAHHREFYAESWFYAHGLLVKTRHSPSFIRTLAVFLFNMAEIPECAMSLMQPGETPVELQEHALLQLKALLSLVNGFAKMLPPASMHRTLIESACSVMHWYGYVRDTSVALMHQRMCILDTVERDRDSHPAQKLSNVSSTIEHVEAICQAAAAWIIELKRGIVTIRDQTTPVEGSVGASPTDAFTLFDQIDAFNAGIGARLTDFLENNTALSPRMEGCISHLLLSWNFGVLALIQCTRDQSALVDSGEVESLKVKMSDIGRQTISDVSSLAARFAASSFSRNGLDSRESLCPPLVARNGNIPLVTAMLVKFLEHAVMLKSHGSLEMQQQDQIVFEDKSFREYHDPVSSILKSLLSLTQTMGGSSGPRTALQSLMARYPDELMHVWTTEVVT